MRLASLQLISFAISPLLFNRNMATSAFLTSVVNANRVDFDRKIDWSPIGKTVRVYHDEVGINPSDDEILKRCEGCDVLVTKEIAISHDLIMRLPGSVKLICEAGTGFNNIDLSAARTRAISGSELPFHLINLLFKQHIPPR